MSGYSATSLKSIQKAKANLTKFLRTVEKVPQDILQQEAIRIQHEARAETPYKTGKLYRSVKCSVSKSKVKFGLNISASARSKHGYNYAGIQHENRYFRHRIGKSRYLIEPFNRGVRRIRTKLKKATNFRRLR